MNTKGLMRVSGYMIDVKVWGYTVSPCLVNKSHVCAMFPNGSPIQILGSNICKVFMCSYLVKLKVSLANLP